MENGLKILVAPLNWGLGHATRCIPIINALIHQGYEPIIASDGVALNLLRVEFPDLHWRELPSYHISYPKNGKHFKFKMIWNSPKMIKAIKNEKKAVKAICKEMGIQGIISDNRLGFTTKNCPVYLSHTNSQYSLETRPSYLQKFTKRSFRNLMSVGCQMFHGMKIYLGN